MTRLPAAALAVVALAAFAALLPCAADARISEHGRTVLFQNVYIAPDEVVYGDLNVIFGDAEIAGRVRGDVNTFFGRCGLIEGGVVDGEEHCVTDDAAQAFLPWVVSSATITSLAARDKRMLLKLGSSAIVLLVFLLFPMRMRLALDRVERHPGLAAATGTGALLAVVPVALLLLVSIVGIPLIALEIAGVLAGVWLGTGAVALLVGRRLAELVWPTATPSPLWALVLGLIVVGAAETVPFVGWAVTALVWLVGLGAAILAFVRQRSFERISSRLGGPPMPA